MGFGRPECLSEATYNRTAIGFTFMVPCVRLILLMKLGKIRFRRVIPFLLAGAMLWSCATQEGVVRDGEKHGATKGVFRGRWWSYYERGSSYLTGQFYSEAEADFRKALDGRGRDTWQARTYGLHFVEYFPNRELGVACFQQGRLDEAEQYLNVSLSQIDTDRAHYYLDLVRKARIAKGEVKCDQPPSLESSLKDGMLLSQHEIPLELRATDAVGVAGVTVNGQLLPQRGSETDLAVKDKVLLTEGTHEIRLEASNLGDKAVAQTVTVEVDLTGPTVGIYSPADGTVTEAGSVTLKGACVDRNGVVSVMLSDRALAEAGGGKRVEFATELPLSDGENTFVVIAKDAAGNETRTAVSVFKGKPDTSAAILWRIRELRPELLSLAASNGVAAVMSLLSAEAQDAAAQPVAITLKSPKADKPYRHNTTLCVSGEVTTATKVASLTINGEPFEELTGAPKESFNRRIPIDDKDDAEKKVPLNVAAKDDQGHETTQSFEVSVRPVHMDSRESKMPVAVLAFAGSGVDAPTADLLRVTSEAKLNEGGRFRMLDRTRLQDVLTEQQLAAALADPNEAITLGKLTNAQVFLVADVFPRDQKGIEIKARAISSETSDIVATLDAFVDDKGDSQKVNEACVALADQLSKVFPRLSGEVMAVRAKPDGSDILVNWTKEDGIREGMYLLVVHEEDPWVDDKTGEVLQAGEVVEVTRGRIERVMSSGSQAKEIRQQGQEAAIEQGMAAVTM